MSVPKLDGPTLRDTIMNTLNGVVRPLEELVPGLPAEIGELVMKLLSLDPQNRPSAERAVDFLESFAAQHQLRWSPDVLLATKAVGR